MSGIEDRLETQLLDLGSSELRLETLIRELRVEVQSAVKAGNLDRADQLASIIELLGKKLGTLQSDIMALERRLYGLRRQRQR